MGLAILILLALIFLFVLTVLAKTIRIVPQARAGIVVTNQTGHPLIDNLRKHLQSWSNITVIALFHLFRTTQKFGD